MDEIPEYDTDATCTTLHVDEAARLRTLADYNRPDQFYTKGSAIRPPTIQGGEFRVEAAILQTRGTYALLWVISRAAYGPSREVQGSNI